MNMSFEKVLELLNDIKNGEITVDDAIRVVSYLKDYNKQSTR